MKNFKDLNIVPKFPLTGIKDSILTVKDKPIIVKNFRFLTKYKDGDPFDVVQIQFNYENDKTNRVTFTRSHVLIGQFKNVQKEMLPFTCTIKEHDDCLFME